MQNRSKIDVKIDAETRMGREPNFDRFWIDLGAILASQNGTERVKIQYRNGIKIGSFFESLLEHHFFSQDAPKGRKLCIFGVGPAECAARLGRIMEGDKTRTSESRTWSKKACRKDKQALNDNPARRPRDGRRIRPAHSPPSV